MSSSDSPPRVKQKVEESVTDRRLHVDLRDPVLLPISQMLLENQWGYLYNCACPAFPRLVREFYGHMTILQDADRGRVMQTIV
jgi:hypothetical protein